MLNAHLIRIFFQSLQKYILNWKFPFDTEIATKQEVRARPPKIVAGLEADKTNELLLAIAKAIDRKIDSTEAVALVKSGNVNLSPKKEPNKSKTSSQNKTESRKTTKDIKDPTGSKKIKNTVNSDKKPQKDKDKNAKLIKQSSKESTDSKRTKTKSHSIDKEKGRDSKKERDGKLQTQKTNMPKNITGPEHVIENTDNPQLNGNSVSTWIQHIARIKYKNNFHII